MAPKRHSENKSSGGHTNNIYEYSKVGTDWSAVKGSNFDVFQHDTWSQQEANGAAVCEKLYSIMNFTSSAGGTHFGWQIMSNDNESPSTLLFIDRFFNSFLSASQMSSQSSCSPWLEAHLQCTLTCM